MKRGFVCFIVLFVAFVCLGQTKERPLVNYNWKYGETILLDNVKVPTNYKEETNNYREGIISYLKYKDGSYIVFHRGGMMQLPFFAERKNYLTESKEEFEDRTFQCGKSKNQKLYWCEVNFKRTPETIKVGIPFPSNFGFDKVKKKTLELYKNSLKSLVLQEKSQIAERKKQLTTKN